MSEPERLADILPAVAHELAVFCGVEEHLTGDLCRRIACDGTHAWDGIDAWTRPSDTPNDRRTA